MTGPRAPQQAIVVPGRKEAERFRRAEAVLDASLAVTAGLAGVMGVVGAIWVVITAIGASKLFAVPALVGSVVLGLISLQSARDARLGRP